MKRGSSGLSLSCLSEEHDVLVRVPMDSWKLCAESGTFNSWSLGACLSNAVFLTGQAAHDVVSLRPG
jgi:hypothetical protein